MLQKYLFTLAAGIAVMTGSVVSAQQISRAIGDAPPVISPSAWFNRTTGSAMLDQEEASSVLQSAPAATAPAGSPGCDACGCGSVGNPVCDSRIGQAGCDSGCGSACDGASGCDGRCNGGGCRGGGRLFGNIIKPSSRCFDDFISPMTNPVYFEDPRNLTEARFIFLNHKVPAAAAGGEVQLYALQLRARLGENVSLIATKDGYINSSNPLISDGWADLSAGLKFNLVRDVAQGRLWSGGFTYEIPSGARGAQQANGDGLINLFVSGGRRIRDRAHWLTAAGWRIPLDSDANSESIYWSNHLDYQLNNKWYALTELNWYHWTQSGAGGVPGVEGLDLFNFGSTGVTGNDIVTAAFGGKLKPSCHSEIGLAWEFPLTARRDIIDNRLTFDWIFRY